MSPLGRLLPTSVGMGSQARRAEWRSGNVTTWLGTFQHLNEGVHSPAHPRVHESLGALDMVFHIRMERGEGPSHLLQAGPIDVVRKNDFCAWRPKKDLAHNTDT
eukprot:TRINITY_DN1534_c0_g1_i1.p1 TRINITY_DN1534_c0_g1~~TRINITY_DN1534_c0_g1_i1.p1  ORF type:complete len:104 (+),score=5.02 TRINITY_DN1534_c0_g1_i1:623-934(+)